jgi:alpha-tubulin suppressor-like RCC1 family protein
MLVFATVAAIVAVIALPGGSAAEQASEPGNIAAAQIDAGQNHSCALQNGQVRCWGFNREGQLGLGHTNTIGDNETANAAPPVDLGPGRTAIALSAGDFHTCVIMDDGRVRCWGFGQNGRIGTAGSGDLLNVGDNETPASVPTVDLGPGRTAKAITAGGAHTCAILDNDTVRCWGYAFYGALGYGNPDPDPSTPDTEPNPVDIGDNETPGSVGPVDLGGHTAKAITAGNLHTCAILEDDTVRCWGRGASGQLGYASVENVGDRGTPATLGPVGLGVGRTAKAIAAGVDQTCAVLDDNSVRCWGGGGDGRLGYGNSDPIGDNETPGTAGPVDLGAGRTARGIAVGDAFACARLDNGDVRCWGFGLDGRTGSGAPQVIGDNETPGSVPPVNIGAGRTAQAVTVGSRHACVRMDDNNVRCWGYGPNGRLGYCTNNNIGDNEVPAIVGPVDLGVPGSNPATCSGGGGGGGGGTPPPRPTPRTPAQPAPPAADAALVNERARRSAYRACLSRVARHTRREIRAARRLSSARKARARIHIKRHRSRLKRACVRRHGRTPGRVTGLRARAAGGGRIVLRFNAAGTDGSKAPPARTYVVKQSRRPVRSARGFRRAQTLCKGRCHFSSVSSVGAPISLTVTDLRRNTTYYYAVAARDNVTRKLGRRSRAAKAKTRG